MKRFISSFGYIVSLIAWVGFSTMASKEMNYSTSYWCFILAGAICFVPIFDLIINRKDK